MKGGVIPPLGVELGKSSVGHDRETKIEGRICNGHEAEPAGEVSTRLGIGPKAGPN